MADPKISGIPVAPIQGPVLEPFMVDLSHRPSPAPQAIPSLNLESFQKLIAPLQSLGVKIDILNPDGTFKKGPESKVAAERSAKALEEYFLKGAGLGLKLKPGSSEYKKAALVFLQERTEFNLLPFEDKLHCLQLEPLNYTADYAEQRVLRNLRDVSVPSQKFALFLRAQAFLREQQGKVADAARIYEKAISLDPQNIYLRIDCARAHQAWASQEKDLAVAKQLRSVAEEHLGFVEFSLQGKLSDVQHLMKSGKLEQASALLKEVRTKYFDSFSSSERKVMGEAAHYYTLLAHTLLLEGEVEDLKDNHAGAVKSYTKVEHYLNQIIPQIPDSTSALLLRARTRHFLQNYKGAMGDYIRAAKQSSAQSSKVENYKALLGKLVEKYSHEQQKAQHLKDPLREMLFLTEEIKVHEALRLGAEFSTGPAPFNPDLGVERSARNVLWKAENSKIEELSSRLAGLSKTYGFENLEKQVKEMVQKGYLNANDLIPFSSYLVLATSSTNSIEVNFSSTFDGLEDSKKLEILQELTQKGLLGENRQAALALETKIREQEALRDATLTPDQKAALEKVPFLMQGVAFEILSKNPQWMAANRKLEDLKSKQLFYQSRVDLLEGNLPAAKLKLRDLKASSTGSQDAEVLKMRKEGQAYLRQFALTALAELEEANEQFKAQRLSNFEMNYYDEKTASSNATVLKLFKDYIQSGKADTLEEAAEFLTSENKRLHEEFWKNPVVKKDWLVTSNYKQPRYGTPEWDQERAAGRAFAIALKQPDNPDLLKADAFPGVKYARLEGGTLEIPWGAQSPPSMRVVIGKEGGSIKSGEYTYVFPPSDRDRLVVISGSSVFSPHMKAYQDYQYYPHRGVPEKDQLGSVQQDYKGGHPSTLSVLAEHWKYMSTRDHDFKMLFQLETREGLQKMGSPEERRAYLLEVVKEIRHRNGSYEVSAKILKGLFMEEYQKAFAEISPTQKEQLRQELEQERGKVEQEVQKSLADMKSENPGLWQKRFPSGEPSAEEIRAMVNQSLEGKLALKMEKLAFRKIDSWHEQGQLRDPISREAWGMFDDMKDPNDKTWNLADESWDRIVDEVVITAVTMPVTMGAGALVRGTLSSSSWALRLAAQGGMKGFGVRAGIFVAGSAVEGLTQETLSSTMFGPPFQWKNVGFNMLMSSAFHGGGKAWGVAAGRLGIDDAALMAAKAEGRSVAGKSALNFTGTMSTQTLVATGMSYAADVVHGEDNPKTFWERLGGESIRMLSYHYGTHAINLATGNLAMNFEILGQAKLKEARKSYLELVKSGVAPEAAYQRAIEYAQGLKLDPVTKNTFTELQDKDLEEIPPPPPEAPAAPPPLPPSPALKPAPVLAARGREMPNLQPTVPLRVEAEGRIQQKLNQALEALSYDRHPLKEVDQVRRELFRQVLEGKITEEFAQKILERCEKREIKAADLDFVLGTAPTHHNIALLEAFPELGSRSGWLSKLMADPKAFSAKVDQVTGASGQIWRLLGIVGKGRDLTPAEREILIADLETRGGKTAGANTEKVFDGILTALQAYHRLGLEQGMPRAEVTELLAALYLRNTPAVISESRLKALEQILDPALRRKEFVKALLQRETPLPTKSTGKANFVDFNTLKAESDRVASADAVMTQAWAKEAIGEVQADVLMADNNFGRKEAYLRVLDHHGVYGQEKNSTEQMLGMFEGALRKVGGEEAVLKPTPAQVDQAIQLLNIREIATDNLADGGWCVWIAQNQKRILANPALREQIRQATHFEDFNAFGNNYDRSDPAVRLQAALFKKYGDNLKAKGIVGSDRFPPDRAGEVIPEAMRDIDRLMRDPQQLEKTANEFWAEVDAAKEVARGAVSLERSVDGKRVLAFYDMTKPVEVMGPDGNPVILKMTDFSIFAQWLAVPELQRPVAQAEKLSLQATLTPMPPVKGPAGDVPRTLPIVAIPHGVELPSGKGLLTVIKAINEAEAARVEVLKQEGKLPPDFKANFWFGKDNVILPNPAPPGHGTVLTPTEIAGILLRPDFGLFQGKVKREMSSRGEVLHFTDSIKVLLPPGMNVDQARIVLNKMSPELRQEIEKYSSGPGEKTIPLEVIEQWQLLQGSKGMGPARKPSQSPFSRAEDYRQRTEREPLEIHREKDGKVLSYKLVFTGEILGIGSGRTVFGGEIIGADGSRTPVAVKLVTHGMGGAIKIPQEMAAFQAFDRAEVGAVKFYGVGGFDGQATPFMVSNRAEGVLITHFEKVPPDQRKAVAQSLAHDMARMTQEGFEMAGDVQFILGKDAAGNPLVQWIDLESIPKTNDPSSTWESRYQEAVEFYGLKDLVPADPRKALGIETPSTSNTEGLRMAARRDEVAPASKRNIPRYDVAESDKGANGFKGSLFHLKDMAPDGKPSAFQQRWKFRVESVAGDKIVLKNDQGRTLTMSGVFREAALPFAKGDEVILLPQVAGGSGKRAAVTIDGLDHHPVEIKTAEIKPVPAPPSEKANLNGWAEQMELGQVYRFESMNAAGTGKETNYVFKDAGGNIYLVPEWLAKKVADHGPRGSKFTVSVEEVLQGMADSVREAPLDGSGRYEMHVAAQGEKTFGLDTVISESEIEARGLQGEKVSVEREMDTIETFVVPDAEISSAPSYGTGQFHAVFLDGNPQYAKEVAAALAQFGVSPESWGAENKGRIRIPITAFPGKYMPPRHVAEPWRGVRTLMSESDYQAWKASRASLEQAGVLKPALALREKILAQDVPALEASLLSGDLSSLPEPHKVQIREKIDILKSELEKNPPNPRNISNAKLELMEFSEAALVLNAKLDPNQVKAGLIMPAGTPKKAEVLLAKASEAAPLLPQSPILEAANFEKLSEIDRGNISKLKAKGILTPETERALDYYVGIPGSEARISEGLKSAAGSLKEGGDPVAAYTALKGLLFELSRKDTVGRMLGIDRSQFTKAAQGPKVTYDGVKLNKSKDPAKPAIVSLQKSSEVEIDVPVVNGHIYEVKSYPRRTVGEGTLPLLQFLNGETPSGPISPDIARLFNQAVKYQAALKQHPDVYKAATIEVEGNIDKGFMILLQKYAPDVEVLCRFPLPNGDEVVFRMKSGGEGRESFARRPAFNTLTPEEKVIIDGIRKSVEDGSVLEALRGNLLKVADVEAAFQEGKISQSVRDQLVSSGMDPLKIKDVEAFKAYEKLTLEKRYQFFTDKSNSTPSHRKNLWAETRSPEALEAEWRGALRQIAESNDAVRVQYDFDFQLERARAELSQETDPKKRPKIEQRIKSIEKQKELTERDFKSRIDAISKYESERAAREQADPSIHSRRLAMGYKGPAEGVPLDPLHIYMDSVKAARALYAAEEGGGAKKGKAISEGEKPRQARTYDAVDSYPRAERVAAEIASGKYREIKHFVEIRYPLEGEGIEIDKSNIRVVAARREFIEPQILEGNVKRLRALRALSQNPEDTSVPREIKRALEFHQKPIDRAEGQLKAVYDEMVDKLRSSPNKQAIRAEYDPRIKIARQELVETYKRALGEKNFDQYTAKILRDFTDNRVKFIYVLNSDGQMRMVQEPLEPGAERPAHSELAGGRNIYAAGEIYIQDGVVTVINNGSGHYRPDAAETFSYVKSTLEASGFKVDPRVKPEQVKLPFVPFNDFDNNISPTPFAKTEAPKAAPAVNPTTPRGGGVIPSLLAVLGFGAANLYSSSAHAADSVGVASHSADPTTWLLVGAATVLSGVAAFLGVKAYRAREAAKAPPLPATSGMTPKAGSTYALLPAADGKDFVIGRGLDSNLVLSHANVSRTHCTLQYREGQGWFLVDGAVGESKGSNNGVKINGKKIQQKETPLQAGDKIEIIGAIFEFQPPEIVSSPVKNPAPRRGEVEEPVDPKFIEAGINLPTLRTEKIPWMKDPGDSNTQVAILGRPSTKPGVVNPSNLFSINDRVVSRRHAEIISTPDGKRFLRDLSHEGGLGILAHGTWVKEGETWRKLEADEKYELKPGQTFALGTVIHEKTMDRRGRNVEKVNLNDALEYTLAPDGNSLFTTSVPYNSAAPVPPRLVSLASPKPPPPKVLPEFRIPKAREAGAKNNPEYIIGNPSQTDAFFFVKDGNSTPTVYGAIRSNNFGEWFLYNGRVGHTFTPQTALEIQRKGTSQREAVRDVSRIHDGDEIIINGEIRHVFREPLAVAQAEPVIPPMAARGDSSFPLETRVMAIPKAVAEVRGGVRRENQGEVKGKLFNETVSTPIVLKEISSDPQQPTEINIQFADKPYLTHESIEGNGENLMKVWQRNGKYWVKFDPRHQVFINGETSRRSASNHLLEAGKTYHIRIDNHTIELRLPPFVF